MAKKEVVRLLLIFIIAAAVLYFTDIGCPILKFTGIPCLGCGMTRACIRLVHLDFAQAFYYHPLVFLLPFCIVLLFFLGKLPKKLVKGFVWAVLVLFILVYFIRLFDPENQVIKWNVEDGVIYRVITDLLTGADSR